MSTLCILDFYALLTYFAELKVSKKNKVFIRILGNLLFTFNLIKFFLRQLFLSLSLSNYLSLLLLVALIATR
jgi:hypothetical protein